MKAWGQKIVLYTANFIAQYHSFIVAIVASSFLAPYVGIENVGYVFAGSSVIVTLVLYAAPAIFRTFGTRNVLSVLAFLEIAALLGLSIADGTVMVIALITIQSVFAYAIFIGIDLLIEASTPHETVTGNNRGVFLTLNNIAILVGSLSLAVIVGTDNYARVFTVAALVMLPFLAITLRLLPSISYPDKTPRAGSVLQQLKSNVSLRYITLAHLLLQILFAWFSIYVPLLLHINEGFSWVEIGIIMAIAMIPYVILEYPLGIIADKWLGEKEILIIGFCIIVIALVGFSLLHGAGFFMWAGIMLFSRIGAAMVEAMTEIHFFRHVNQNDPNSITMFRALKPVGNIIGTVVASLILIVIPLSTTFALFGAFMIIGIPLALRIVDSK